MPIQEIWNPVTERYESVRGEDGAVNTAVIGGVTLRELAEVSDGNSTSTPLAADVTFTGAWVDALQFVSIGVVVRADVASANKGLIVEQSSDGTNVDTTDTYTIVPNIGRVFSFQRAARYVRVRYINGSSPQTVFRLQTILSKIQPRPTSHNISEDLNGEDDANLVISVLTGQRPNGSTWGHVRVDQYDRLMTVTAGESSPEHGPVFGEAAVSNTTETHVVSPAYAEQASGAQRSIVSTSAEDSSSGTGIRSLEITYHRSDLTGPFTEVVETNGLTPVDLVETDLRFVQRMRALTVGSSGAAVGDVQLKAATAGGGATIWSIAAATNETFGGHLYVAPDADIHVRNLIAGVNANQPASMYLLFHAVLTPNAAVTRISPVARVTQDGQSTLVFDSPIGVLGPGRVVVAVKRDAASGTHTYFGAFTYYRNANT